MRWADLGGDPLDLFFGIAWSPDSKTVLVDKSDLYIKDRRLFLVDPVTGTKLLLRETDPKNVTAEWWSDWAPDGHEIYFTSDRDNDYHLYYQSRRRAGGEPKPITSGKFAVFSVSVSPAAHAVFIVTNQGNRRAPSFPRAARGRHAATNHRNRGHHSPVPSPDGQYFADVFSNDTTPPDLYLSTPPNLRPQVSSTQQITHSPLPEFDDYHWVAAKYVDFPNVNDGICCTHASLYRPASTRQRNIQRYWAPSTAIPSITNGEAASFIPHGDWTSTSPSKGTSFSTSTSAAVQGMARPSVNASAWITAASMSTIYIVASISRGQGFVDEHRVGIWGSSYGGLLTTMSLFTRPGVYQAGVAGAPATSLFHAHR